MKKTIIVVTIVTLVVLALLGAVLGITIKILNNPDSNTVFKSDPKGEAISYQSELLGINFKDYVIESKGSVSKHLQEEDYAYAKFKLDSSKIDSFYVVINEKMRDITDEEISVHYSVEEVNNDATNLELIKKYSAFLSGKRAKTREVMGFLYKNDQNEYYLYLVG